MGESGNEWQEYWTQVKWSQNAPTITVNSGKGTSAKLIKLPDPSGGTSRFPIDYAKPLPGDAFVFSTGGTRVGGIWWGNRKFPRRKYETSFFYYPPIPWVTDSDGNGQQSSTSFDFGESAGATIFGGTVYNSFPPRLTPVIVRELYPKVKDKYLKPNSVLFEGARGYFASASKHAYGGFFVAPDSWVSSPEVRLYCFRPRERPEYVALEREMPYFMQIETRDLLAGTKFKSSGEFGGSDSCVFAAYAKIRAYEGKGSKYENANPAVYETSLIGREVLDPKSSSRRQVSEALEAYNKSIAKLNPKSLYHWSWIAYSKRFTAPLDDGVSGMAPVAQSKLTSTSLRQVIYKYVGNDVPLLALLECSSWTEGSVVKDDAVGSLRGYRRIAFGPTQPNSIGHAVVITGARLDKKESKWYVYFVATNPFNMSRDRGKFVVPLPQFVIALRPPISRGALSNNNDWKTVPNKFNEKKTDPLNAVDFPSLFRLRG